MVQSMLRASGRCGGQGHSQRPVLPSVGRPIFSLDVIVTCNNLCGKEKLNVNLHSLANSTSFFFAGVFTIATGERRRIGFPQDWGNVFHTWGRTSGVLSSGFSHKIAHG